MAFRLLRNIEQCASLLVNGKWIANVGFGKQSKKVRRVLPEERKLIQLTVDGKFVAKHDTLADAVAAVDAKPCALFAALYRGCGICKGYRWLRNADYLKRMSNQHDKPCSD